MTAITMETAIQAARMNVQAKSQPREDELITLLKAATKAADNSVVDPEIKSKVTVMVRSGHFDSMFAAAMLVDAMSDREVDVVTAVHASYDPQKTGSLIYVGFTDFSEAELAAMRDSGKQIAIIAYQGSVVIPRAKARWFDKEEPKGNPNLKVIGIHQYFHEGMPISFGKLESLISTSLIDITFTWLTRNKMDVTNPTLLKYRTAAARYVSGAWPIVLDNSVGYKEILPRERQGEQLECKAALIEMETALFTALRSRDVQTALKEITVGCDTRAYTRMWSDVVNTLQVCGSDCYVRVPNKSPVMIGSPTTKKPVKALGRTSRLLIASCSEGQWPMMTDAMSNKTDCFATYQDTTTHREWRIVTPDIGLSTAIAHKLGEVVWNDGYCVRALGKKD